MSVAYENLFNTVTQKIFSDIFNYTAVTLKNNVKLTIMNNGVTVRNMIYNNVISTLLPDTINTYYLFLCSDVSISNLLAGNKGWVNLEDILNTKKVCADFITIDDKMIPKCMVFGRVNHSGETILAIDVRAYKKLNTKVDTYLTINVNTDTIGVRTVMSHIPVDRENLPAIMTAVQQYPSDQYLGFINGFVYRNDIFAKTNIIPSDYYECYHDTNVKFTFIVDLAIRNNYHNSTNTHYQDIIIIPANLSQGETFTYDTIAIVVRDYNGKGVYIPFIADDSITQLTHNSFSISSYIIDAAFDKLGVDKGELYVIVSDYSKNNTNDMNGDLTEQLYSLDDSQIMKALMNQLNPHVDCWTADVLAKSVYSKYLIDMTELDKYDKVLIKKQIECLGYYEFATTLCKHNGEFKDLGTVIDTLNIQVPIFWNNTDVYPILYRDGEKIPYSRYTCVRDGDDLQVKFEVPLPLHFTYSVIQYELMVKAKPSAYKCNVDINNSAITIPKQDGTLHVYYRINSMVSGITEDTYQGYNELTLTNNVFYSVTTTDTEYVIMFTEHAYSNTFVFIFDNNTLVNNHLNVDISDGRTINFIPTTTTIGSNETVNILPNGNYDVYCNGRFMVKGIDYCISKLLNVHDLTAIGGYDIVIQNLKVLHDSETNHISIYNTNQVVLSSDIGYIVDGIIPRNTNNDAWIRGISRLFVNGKLVPFDCVTQTSTHYVIDARYTSNGYIYQFTNAVSRDFYDTYKDYMDVNYFNNRNVVTEYFVNGYHYTNIEPVIIQYGNKIYSSYLNEIIHRIIEQTVTINFINDDTDIINQLRDYEYLKKFDVIFNDPNLINKRFVDIYPEYLAQIKISDLNHYLYIQRLVKLVIGDDLVTDHRVVYTGN